MDFNEHLDRERELLSRDYQLLTESYISRGWELFKKDPGHFIAFALIILIGPSVISRIQPFAGVGVGLVVSAMEAGFFVAARKISRGERLLFQDFFSVFDRFGTLLLAVLVKAVFIVIGLALGVLPGIYLGVAYLFVMPFILFENMGFWQAMETSRKLITKHWFSFLGLAVLGLLIILAGAIACGIGLIVSYPVWFCIIYVAYEDVVERQLASPTPPPIHNT